MVIWYFVGSKYVDSQAFSEDIYKKGLLVSVLVVYAQVHEYICWCIVTTTIRVM